MIMQCASALKRNEMIMRASHLLPGVMGTSFIKYDASFSNSKLSSLLIYIMMIYIWYVTKIAIPERGKNAGFSTGDF